MVPNPRDHKHTTAFSITQLNFGAMESDEPILHVLTSRWQSPPHCLNPEDVARRQRFDSEAGAIAVYAQHERSNEKLPAIGKRPLYLLAISVLLITTTPGALLANTSGNAKSVLVLLPGNTGNPAMNLIFEGIQRQMVSLGSDQILLMPARVDSLAEGSPNLKTAQDRWFRARYGNERVDLIIPVSTPPLLMALEFRNRFKPGTPIVACCPYQNTFGADAMPLTGIFGQYPWKENVELIKKLFPSTRQIALVGGDTPSDRALNRPLREILRQHSPPIGFIDLSNLTATEQLERAQKLPDDTVLMFGSLLNDVAGNEIQHGPGGLRASLARESNSPLIFVTELNFGQGGVGGYMVNWLELGQELGTLGLVILFSPSLNFQDSGKSSPGSLLTHGHTIVFELSRLHHFTPRW